jgi:hypothetical protein
MVDLEKVGAHFAVSSLFQNYPDHAQIYSITVDQEDVQLLTAGKARLAIGRIKVLFGVTRITDTLSYVVLHMGDHNLNGGVRTYAGPEAYEAMKAEISETFSRADFPQIIRLMDRHFGESNYSLKSLFRDEQRSILNQILASTMQDLESRYRQVSDSYGPLMRFLGDLKVPLPRVLQLTEDFVLNADLRKQFESEEPDLRQIRAFLAEAASRKVALDKEGLNYALKANFDRMILHFSQRPRDIALLHRLDSLAGILPSLPFEVNLWKTQNLFSEMWTQSFPDFQQRADQGDAEARDWVAQFLSLGNHLGFLLEARPS